MNRPALQVADIIRAQGERFLERCRSWLTWPQRKVLRAISYNSCRNRHCPKCQTGARNRWLAERSKELLPVRYVHVVFTLPHP
ncbi:MAG: transposase zinc-binding domain-containing protein, partial [Terracidiphilus sp.]